LQPVANSGIVFSPITRNNLKFKMKKSLTRFVAFLKKRGPRRKPTLYRILFRHSDFRQLPEEQQLFFIRLAHVADDLRHVFYLCVAAERGMHSRSSDERKLALHQLLFGVRLVYSILYEGWNVISSVWNEQGFRTRWRWQVSDEAREGLSFLGRYFANENLSRTIRNKFGFHYDVDQLREPLARASERTDEIMSGKQNGNIFYTFAEEIRSIALLRAAVQEESGTLWDDNATEANVRQAAIRLYEAYMPVRKAFEAFANDVLVKIVKSLPRKIEKFTPPRVIKFSEMSPVLFVQELSLEEARAISARASS
jgi:hypothetical protein